MAVARPARRDSRTVPPKPGNRPSFTSGTPTWAVSAITRSGASIASSSPPPSAKPLMATTLGTARSSKALNSSLLARTPRAMSASACWKVAPNSVMSAPTMNTSFALVTRTPRTSGEAAMRSVAWRNSSTVRASSLLMA
ncbi:hypothetical protein D3C72_1861470 [compost metagenome]